MQRCRDRILGNPRFLLVLAIEEAMGVSAKLSAEVNARGDNFKKVRRAVTACSMPRPTLRGSAAPSLPSMHTGSMHADGQPCVLMFKFLQAGVLPCRRSTSCCRTWRWRWWATPRSCGC